MTQDEIERVYDDFLYDCYIANKRLTPEDWVEYGRERHHMEIPARDNGVLTPLNAQDLTQYQHWVAGVLQSEVLQKGCFAMIPVGALPVNLEVIRAKWVQELAREGNQAWLTNTTPEERSKMAMGDSTPEERSRRTSLGWQRMSEEARRERIIKSNVLRSKESKEEATRKRLEKMSPEKLKEAARKRLQSTTPEQRSEAARKRWAKLSPDQRREITKNATEAAAAKARQARVKTPQDQNEQPN
jgi:hypothetical protein